MNVFILDTDMICSTTQVPDDMESQESINLWIFHFLVCKCNCDSQLTGMFLEP